MKTAYIQILSAAALWGCIGFFFKKLTFIGFTSMQVVALRVGGAALLFALLLACTRPALLRIRLRDWPYFFGTGICSLLFFNFCYFNAISLSSLAVAAVLLYTSPIFVMILSALLFHEPITRRKVLALALTFAGCILVTGLGQAEAALTPTAILFGLGSGFGYALYSIFGKYALERYDSSTVSLYTFLFAALGAIPLSGIHTVPSLLLRWDTLLYSLGIGALCCLLPYVLYTRGLALIETSRAAILATLEPAVATLMGLLFFHESMTLAKGAGMLLIFSAIVLLNSSAAIKKEKV
jgi:DME family drug/metabolite transporter